MTARNDATLSAQQALYDMLIYSNQNNGVNGLEVYSHRETSNHADLHMRMWGLSGQIPNNQWFVDASARMAADGPPIHTDNSGILCFDLLTNCQLCGLKRLLNAPTVSYRLQYASQTEVFWNVLHYFIKIGTNHLRADEVVNCLTEIETKLATLDPVIRAQWNFSVEALLTIRRPETRTMYSLISALHSVCQNLQGRGNESWNSARNLHPQTVFQHNEPLILNPLFQALSGSRDAPLRINLPENNNAILPLQDASQQQDQSPEQQGESRPLVVNHQDLVVNNLAPIASSGELTRNNDNLRRDDQNNIPIIARANGENDSREQNVDNLKSAVDASKREVGSTSEIKPDGENGTNFAQTNGDTSSSEPAAQKPNEMAEVQHNTIPKNSENQVTNAEIIIKTADNSCEDGGQLFPFMDVAQSRPMSNGTGTESEREQSTPLTVDMNTLSEVMVENKNNACTSVTGTIITLSDTAMHCEPIAHGSEQQMTGVESREALIGSTINQGSDKFLIRSNLESPNSVATATESERESATPMADVGKQKNGTKRQVMVETSIAKRQCDKMTKQKPDAVLKLSMKKAAKSTSGYGNVPKKQQSTTTKSRDNMKRPRGRPSLKHGFPNSKTDVSASTKNGDSEDEESEEDERPKCRKDCKKSRRDPSYDPRDDGEGPQRRPIYFSVTTRSESKMMSKQ